MMSSSTKKAKSFFPSARLTRNEPGRVMLYQHQTTVHYNRAPEPMAHGLFPSKGHSQAQQSICSTTAPPVFCCSLIDTGLGNTNLYEVSDDRWMLVCNGWVQDYTSG